MSETMSNNLHRCFGNTIACRQYIKGNCAIRNGMSYTLTSNIIYISLSLSIGLHNIRGASERYL